MARQHLQFKLTTRGSRSWRKVLYSAGLAAGAILFLGQFYYGAQGLAKQQPGIPQVLYVVAAAVVVILAYLIQMLAWKVILAGLGSSISLYGVLSGYVLSFLPRYIPGSVWGYLGRGEWLKSHWGVPYSTSAVSSILEVAVGFLTAVVTAVVCYVWHVGPAWLRLLAIGGALLAPWLSWRVFKWIVGALPVRWLARLGVSRTSDADLRFAHWLAAYLLYIGLWLCYGAALDLLTSGLVRVEVGLIQVTPIYAMSWVVGFLVLVVPAGLGVREAALSTLLVWQLSLDTQSAGGVSVACRVVVYLAEMAWLVVGLVLSRTTARKNRASGRSLESLSGEADSAPS